MEAAEIWPITLPLQVFFPNVIQPPVAVISNTVHGMLVKIGLCRKVVRRFDMANPTGVTISVPASEQHDMERRRQIALKALSERLSKSQDKQLLIPKPIKPNPSPLHIAIPVSNTNVQTSTTPVNITNPVTVPTTVVTSSPST
uniref:Uncharacterized protein n=1 Tax=Photinus pyralis TaxID=7054 RepID=A0A1Y1L7D6_PHOPY